MSSSQQVGEAKGVSKSNSFQELVEEVPWCHKRFQSGRACPERNNKAGANDDAANSAGEGKQTLQFCVHAAKTANKASKSTIDSLQCCQRVCNQA